MSVAASRTGGGAVLPGVGTVSPALDRAAPYRSSTSHRLNATAPTAPAAPNPPETNNRRRPYSPLPASPPAAAPASSVGTPSAHSWCRRIVPPSPRNVAPATAAPITDGTASITPAPGLVTAASTPTTPNSPTPSIARFGRVSASCPMNAAATASTSATPASSTSLSAGPNTAIARSFTEFGVRSTTASPTAAYGEDPCRTNAATSSPAPTPASPASTPIHRHCLILTSFPPGTPFRPPDAVTASLRAHFSGTPLSGHSKGAVGGDICRPTAPLVVVVRRRPTLPHPGGCSTIGAEGLSFRVRDGAGRFPFAMAAVTSLAHTIAVFVVAGWVALVSLFSCGWWVVLGAGVCCFRVA